MFGGYRFADLSEEDRRRLSALEADLARKYRRDVVIIAYEKDPGSAGSSRMEVGRLGVDSQERGSTFGYGDAHFDAYPTLPDVMGQQSPGHEGEGRRPRQPGHGAKGEVTERPRPRRTHRP